VVKRFFIQYPLIGHNGILEMLLVLKQTKNKKPNLLVLVQVPVVTEVEKINLQKIE
jgi:hypothetical protein